jgi:hypothetical protein
MKINEVVSITCALLLTTIIGTFLHVFEAHARVKEANEIAS